MTTQSVNYYRQRIDEELVAAQAADNEVISLIHRDMAQRYRDLLGVELPKGKTPNVGSGPALG